MHMLSERNRDEFLATPQLIRFENVPGSVAPEPTLLIKASTLLLKYIVLGVRVQLAFASCEDRLLYAVQIMDDGDDGAILWSIAKTQSEKDAISAIANGQGMIVFLFNEIAVNVAWKATLTIKKNLDLIFLLQSTSLDAVNYKKITSAANRLLDKLGNKEEAEHYWANFEIGGRSDWHPLRNHLITASASSSLINIFDHDEGNQQEQIGIWLTNNLQPTGAHHRPERPYKETLKRELTDILLSHEFGAEVVLFSCTVFRPC